MATVSTARPRQPTGKSWQVAAAPWLVLALLAAVVTTTFIVTDNSAIGEVPELHGVDRNALVADAAIDPLSGTPAFGVVEVRVGGSADRCPVTYGCTSTFK